MATVPVTRTFVAGEVVLDTHFNNNIRDVLNFLLSPPQVRCRQTAGQGITTGGTPQPLTFTTEDIDSSGMHSTVSNTSRFTAVYPGWYWCNGGVDWPASATGTRVVGWQVTPISSGVTTGVNGGDTSIQGFAGLTNRQPARFVKVFLNVGDYVELTAFQNSGGTLTLDTTTTAQSSADIDWRSN